MSKKDKAKNKAEPAEPILYQRCEKDVQDEYSRLVGELGLMQLQIKQQQEAEKAREHRRQEIFNRIPALSRELQEILESTKSAGREG